MIKTNLVFIASGISKEEKEDCNIDIKKEEQKGGVTGHSFIYFKSTGL